MVWERRRVRRYYYRSTRRTDAHRRRYFGSGPVAELAAKIDKLRRAEETAHKVAEKAAETRFEEAEGALNQYWASSELLIKASMLAAGFRRPERHRWTRWNSAKRVLQQRR